MIPGINPKQMQQAMKKMGMQQEDVDAEEVIIKCADKTITIKNPSVQKINMMGQKSYQISGEESIDEAEEIIEITDDDIKTVMDQAGVSEEQALKALEDTEGDIAAAIMKLKG